MRYVFVVTYAILLIAKLFGAVDYNWFIVISPLLIELGIRGCSICLQVLSAQEYYEDEE